MAFKSGLIVGFATGYVLGAKAGRERYERIVSAWHRFSGSPKVHQLTGKGKELAGEAGRKSLSAVQQGVTKASTAVRNRLGDGERDKFAPGEAGL